jgi:spermidine/putrescine transport system permease protein
VRAYSLERAERRTGWVLVAPALLWTIAFFVLPFAVMAAMSFATKHGKELVFWSLSNYAQFFEKAYLLKGLFVSLEITFTVTIVSVVLAYPLAWIIAERVPKRFQRLALMLAVLPFWTSYVVRSYSWLLVLAKNGVINQALMNMGLIAEPLELASTRTATVIGFVHFFVMLLTLTIYSNLIQ